MTERLAALCDQPAFPFVVPDGCGGFQEAFSGMTLRDWFAGQALASIMQDKAIWDSTPDEELDIGQRMYRWADAMLLARAHPETNDG